MFTYPERASLVAAVIYTKVSFFLRVDEPRTTIQGRAADQGPVRTVRDKLTGSDCDANMLSGLLLLAQVLLLRRRCLAAAKRRGMG